MLPIPQRLVLVLLHYLTSEKGRQYVLASIMCQIWVHFVIEKWFNQSNYNNLIMKIDSVILNYYLTGEKADTMC